MKTEILYEDNSILVIRKPAGLAVQSAGIGQPDVVSELKSHLAKLPDTGRLGPGKRRAISGHSPQTGSAGGGCAGIRQREKVGSSSDETIVGGHIE